jgi:hypothetical protein
MNLISNKTATTEKRVPVFAGMKMVNGKTIQNKMSNVGYKIVRFTYDVNIYDGGHEDWMLINEKTLKTVIIK